MLRAQQMTRDFSASFVIFATCHSFRTSIVPSSICYLDKHRTMIVRSYSVHEIIIGIVEAWRMHESLYFETNGAHSAMRKKKLILIGWVIAWKIFALTQIFNVTSFDEKNHSKFKTVTFFCGVDQSYLTESEVRYSILSQLLVFYNNPDFLISAI